MGGRRLHSEHRDDHFDRFRALHAPNVMARHRHKLLHAALVCRGLVLRSDSVLCERYVANPCALANAIVPIVVTGHSLTPRPSRTSLRPSLPAGTSRGPGA